MVQGQSGRKTVHHVAKIGAPVEKVFPLLCPVREYEWIDGWSCRLVHSESGFAEKGAIFTTGFRAEGFSIWTVSRYEFNRAIEFVVVFPGSHVATVEIALKSLEPDRTQLTWTCAFTSLVEPNAYVAGVDQESFDRQQAFFDRALEHFCKTGQMLRRESA